MSRFADYIVRVIHAALNRPMQEREALQCAADLDEGIRVGEGLVADRLAKDFGRPVMVKAVNESWLLIAERGSPWGLLTQHTLGDVHFDPVIQHDVLVGLHASKRLPHHPARYRAPAIGRIS